MTESRLIERVKTLIEPSPAAPVGELPELPEPDSFLFQHDETGNTMFVDAQQVEWGFEKNNPRLHKIGGAFTEGQMRAYGEQCWKAGYKHGAWGDKPAVNQQLTTEQLDEREAFEREMSKPPFEFCMDRWPDDGAYAWPGNYTAYHTQCAWMAWQARAALSAGDADPLTRYRVWPDGTVQEGSESPYAWKSDDFAYVDAVTEEQAHETLKIKELLAANATKMIETADQQPAATESVAWNSIQTASWIGSQLMHQPSMFERAAVCKFVRSLGRHPTLLKHSPKTHPVPSVPADVVRDAARYRWLADCNNYEAGLALIIDPKLTEQALGAAIDAALRKDKP